VRFAAQTITWWVAASPLAGLNTIQSLAEMKIPASAGSFLD
jgi:hypothetical protein